MTDSKDPFASALATEIAEEFEVISKRIPAVPSDFSELRRLLALLPDPIASETPSSGSGDPGAFSVGAAMPSQSSSSLVGAAPGTIPAATLGGGTVAPVLALQVNLIDDGPLDSISGAFVLPARTASVLVSSDFDGWYETTSGPNPQFYFSTVQRLDPSNPFNSGQILIGSIPIAACDATGSIFGPGPTYLGKALVAAHLASPFVVGQVRVFRPAGNVYTNLTALTMTLELWREWRSGGARETLMSSLSADILTMSDSAQMLLKVSSPSTNWTAGEHVSIVVKLNVVATAAAASVVVAFAEPAISMNTTADAPAFAPLLSHYRAQADDYLAYQFYTF